MIPATPPTAVCQCCGVRKPTKDFATTSDGLRISTTCKACAPELAKEKVL